MSDTDDMRWQYEADRLHSLAVLQLVGSDLPADDIFAALAWMAGESETPPRFVVEAEL